VGGGTPSILTGKGKPQIPPTIAGNAPPTQSLGAGKGIIPPGEKPPVPAPELPGKRPKPTLQESMEKARNIAGKARELRPGIKKEYTEQLRNKWGRIAETFKEEGGGVEAYQKAKQILSGGMRGVPEITKGLSPDDIENLYQAIMNSKRVTVPEKFSAMYSFEELLGTGKIPEPKQLGLLEDIFGTDFIRPFLSGKVSIGDITISAMNIFRTLQSGVLDMSPILLQNAVYSFSRPLKTIKALPQSIIDFFSAKRFKAWYKSVYNSPVYLRARGAGLAITDPQKLSLGLLGKEEVVFGQDLLEKIPWLGEIPKATSRFYHGFINRMRWDVFNHEAKALERLGFAAADDPKVFSDVAKVINITTTRGPLTDSQIINSIASTVFYSPRNMTSKFQMLNPVFYSRLAPNARKLLMRDFAVFVGAGATLTGLIGAYLSATGRGDVTLDPASTDFGKVTVGRKHYSLWGGFQPLVRTIFQLALGYKTSASGKEIPLDASQFSFLTRTDVVESFFANKLAPVPRILYDWARGEKAYKDEDANWIKDKLAPMYIADVLDAWKDEQEWALVTVLPWAIIGGGIQVYGKAGVYPQPKVWLPEDAERATKTQRMVQLLRAVRDDTTMTFEQKRNLAEKILQKYEGDNNGGQR
jgi:hypothetical protein